jgi:hypothetical protein
MKRGSPERVGREREGALSLGEMGFKVLITVRS